MGRRGGSTAKPRQTKTPKDPIPPSGGGGSPTLDSKPKRAKPFDFDFTTSGKKEKAPASSSSPFRTSSPSPVLTKGALPSTISGLREQAASEADALRRRLDLWHVEALKEFEASDTRISKRFKLTTQACMQISEEAEKEYRKLSEEISEGANLVKSSYAKFIKEAEISASRVRKVTLPELNQSLERAIDNLRSRYKIPVTPV